MKTYTFNLTVEQLTLIEASLKNFDVEKWLYPNGEEIVGSKETLVDIFNTELSELNFLISVYSDGLQADYGLEDNVKEF